MALLRSVATVGSYTLVSRVLGFIRDILTAAILGAGPVADAFFVAQRLPNLFRSLFAEGAFSAAFVPLASGALAEGGKPAVREFAGEAFAVLFAVLLGFVLLGEIFMPAVMAAIAPGFGADPGKPLGDHPTLGAVAVKSGRYGAYVTAGGVNATIPSDKTQDTITLPEAIALIDERVAKGGAKPKRVAKAKAAKPAKGEADAKAPKPVKKAAVKKAAAKPKSDAVSKARAPVTATAKTSPAKTQPASKTPAKKSAGKARG